jgi:hypothetical protein
MGDPGLERCWRRPCTRSKHPAYRERYQRNKRRFGKQRGAKVAQIDIAPGESSTPDVPPGRFY